MNSWFICAYYVKPGCIFDTLGERNMYSAIDEWKRVVSSERSISWSSLIEAASIETTTGMGVVPVLPFTYWSQEPTYHVSTLCNHNLQDWDRKRPLESYGCQAIRNPIKVPVSRQRRRRRRKVIRNPIEACGGRVSTHCQADRPVVGVWEPPRGHTRLPPSCNTCTLQSCNSVTLDCPHLVTTPPSTIL